MASEPIDPKRFRVSSKVRHQESTGTRSKVRLDVGVEHLESGIRGGDYIEGFYTEPQLEVKATELAAQIAQDLDAVVQGSSTQTPRYMTSKRK